MSGFAHGDGVKATARLCRLSGLSSSNDWYLCGRTFVITHRVAAVWHLAHVVSQYFGQPRTRSRSGSQ